MMRGSGRFVPQFGRSGISRKLITAANEGCLSSLSQIHHALQKNPEFCTVDVVKLVFKHLDPAPLAQIQPWDSEGNRPYSDRAVKCLALLADVSVAAVKNPVLKDFAAGELVAAVDGVCQWLNHYFGSVRPSSRSAGDVGPDVDVELFGYTRIFMAILDWDHSGWSTCWSSPAYCSLMVRMWMTKNAKGRYAIAPTKYLAGYPIERLVFECATYQQGGELFYAEIVTQPRSSDRFAEAAISRAKACMDLCRNGSDTECALEYLNTVLSIATQGANYSPLLARGLSRRRYMKEFTAAMLTLSHSVLATDSKTLGTFCVSTHELLSTVLRATEEDIDQNLAALVDGGYLDILGHLTAILPEDDSAIDKCERDSATDAITDLIVTLLGHSISPRIISSILDNGIRLDVLSQKCRNGKLQPSWNKLCELLQSRVYVYQAMIFGKAGASDICNNLSCPRQTHGALKECSGCSSVTYCSHECQVEDWKAIHREECGCLRHSRSDQKAAHVHYRHSAQTYHIAYVEFSLNQCLQSIEDSLRAPTCPPNLNQASPHDFIIVFDIPGHEIRIQRLELVSHESPLRYNRICEIWRSKPDARLVIATFGDRYEGVVSLLVELEAGAGGGYEAIHSMVLYGSLCEA
ncbi:hypothetical protein DFP72DRAFT_895083 [Ephemerocybe angulata]|uniref:MYND-type domain-containing protein n=1 Tax=Ephemerocybe angulata TaxID=980116 RepID=A0A8H6M9P8_9AGAR|nr:hypothetical protein DFP72DRAFT_895083 [Tulosesus angulatus]